MTLRVGLIQLAVGSCKKTNLKSAAAMIKAAKDKGASLVSLPECFNSPYGTKYFPQYAESIPSGESVQMLSQAAKENDVYLIGGSIKPYLALPYLNFCRINSRKRR